MQMPWVIGLAAGFGSAFAKPLTELVLTKAVQLTAGEECVIAIALSQR